MRNKGSVLYLKEIRTLEYAKKRLEIKYNQEKDAFNKKTNQFNNKYYQMPTQPKEEKLMNFSYKDHTLGLTFEVFWFLLTLYASIKVSETTPVDLSTLLMPIIMVLPAIPAILDYRKCKKHNDKVQERNSHAQLVYKNEVEKIEKEKLKDKVSFDAVKGEWQEREVFFKNEINQINGLLQDYYSVQLIPEKCRDIDSLNYMYTEIVNSNISLGECINNLLQLAPSSIKGIRNDDSQLMVNRIVEAKDEYTINMNIQILTESSTNEEIDKSISNKIIDVYKKSNLYFKDSSYLIMDM